MAFPQIFRILNLMRFNILSFLLFTLAVPLSSFAKVGDPSPILFRKWVITAHERQVVSFEHKAGEALRYCISHSCKKMWSTQLPLPEYVNGQTHLKPELETDVQQCRIQKLEIVNAVLSVEGCDHRFFLLDPKKGRILRGV